MGFTGLSWPFGWSSSWIGAIVTTGVAVDAPAAEHRFELGFLVGFLDAVAGGVAIQLLAMVDHVQGGVLDVAHGALVPLLCCEEADLSLTDDRIILILEEEGSNQSTAGCM